MELAGEYIFYLTCFETPEVKIERRKSFHFPRPLPERLEEILLFREPRWMLKPVFDSSFAFKADFLRAGAGTVAVRKARYHHAQAQRFCFGSILNP